MKPKKRSTQVTQDSLFDLEKEPDRSDAKFDLDKNKENNGIKTIYPSETSDELRQEFFIPLCGFVWLYPEEVEVVNHPMFQRLGNIYQLGQTYLVYRGATHKRIEHVLGTLHIAHRMIAAIKYSYKKSRVRNEDTAPPLSTTEERFLRLGALLHDIGHVAAGHTLEDELCLICKHDSDERIDLIFNNKENNWVDKYSRSLKELIDAEFASYLPESLKLKKISPSTIIRLLIRKTPDLDKLDDKFYKEQKELEKSNEIRLSVCRDIIGNTICADLLDYLYRDWYHVGKQKTFDERILQYMQIKPSSKPSQIDRSTRLHSDRFVISLGNESKIRTDAVSSILDLLESRYHLAESVLFHKTKIAASAMLDRALYALWGDSPEEIEEFILPLSDEQLIAECRKKAEERKNQIAIELLTAIEKRQLYKAFDTYSFWDPKANIIRDNVQRLYFKNPEGPKVAARNRAAVLQNLEEDFKLPKGSLTMYCPDAKMNAKLAEVSISLDDDIEQLCFYEKNNDNRLSGGHLDAQMKRFHRLWKVYFFMNRDILEANEHILDIIQETIYKLVLGCRRTNETYENASFRLATNLKSIPNSPWEDSEIDHELIDARVAYKSSNQATVYYPSGAPCLRIFFKS